MVVRDGLELAYAHEGASDGDPARPPLLLVHGWPETRRIWWKVIAPLAAAGFEVIAPDLRGFGDSAIPADGFHDITAHADDLHALLTGLGHASCVAVGGDLGGGAIQELGLRHPGSVERQVLFNTILPLLGDAYAAAGLPVKPAPEVLQATDYYARQGHDADGLAGELRSDRERTRYIETFYTSRFWATPGAFTREEVRFLAEPFADAAKLRASFGNYESAVGAIPRSALPRFFETNPVPTLVLYGPDDHVMWRDFCERCEVVFTDLVGPFVVPRAGHFLQWERAELLVKTLGAYCRDLV